MGVWNWSDAIKYINWQIAVYIPKFYYAMTSMGKTSCNFGSSADGSLKIHKVILCALQYRELSYSSSTYSYYEKSGKRNANFAFKISHYCRKVAAKKMTKTCWHAFNKPRENRHWNNKKFWKVAKYENCQKNSQGLLVIYIQTSLPLLCFCRRQHYSGHPNQLLFSKTAKNKGILIFHVKDN